MAAPSTAASQQHPGPSTASQQPQPLQQTDVDPIAKIKSLLLPRLKESLSMGNPEAIADIVFRRLSQVYLYNGATLFQTLFKVAGQALSQNAQQDSGVRSGEGYQQKFDKSLEDFYGVCDQVEVSLRLALENQSQVADSNKFTPQTVLQSKGDNPPQEGQLYPNYLATIRSQTACAKEVHDMLHECVRKLSERM